MAGLEIKNAQQPDERRSMSGKGEVQVVKIGDHSAMAGTWEPGWRWSEHIKPIAGTDSCQVDHRGTILAGRIHVVMNDGTEADAGAGDVYVIPPGHDAWVVGDEPLTFVDVSPQMEHYAKP
jgi:uncharacterized cupin superfamily protein